MKTHAIKLLSLLLTLLMLLSVSVVAIQATEQDSGTTDEGTTDDGATTPDNHTLTGNALLKAYGIVCNSKDNDDGTNGDVAEAKITGADGNAYLELKFGDSASYPKIFLDATNETADAGNQLYNYTVSIDFIVVDNSTNKLINFFYANNGSKDGTVGFRTGPYTEDKNWGIVQLENMALQTATDKMYFGEGIFSASKTEKGTVHTFEVTVNAEKIGAVPTISVTVDGVNVGVTNTAALATSRIGFSGYKGSVIGIDNICLKDNTTDTVVTNITFEDHSYGDTLQSIDDDNHGFACVCGVAVTEAHAYDAGVEIDDETSCTTKKSMKYTCSICQHEKVVANQHTPGELETVNDTCTEDGYTSIKCTVCNEELQHTVIENDGHDYGLWEKTDNGKKRTCTVCGAVEEDVEETKAPETEATPAESETQAPAATEEKKGCGAVVATPAITALLVGGALLFAKKKKED